ncbi:metallophosphatase family protein [Desulfovibrio mangrovi]|uniref:metallophosphoesterase family protein n=1 Tax=Desulfovibrio mangrovi TaxID=2976983 RepID=UPI0022450F07|nr:metallophosphoesterase family protein [Desulfovibrio mangrovi]UZP66130.1 metallophosphatase family protein [Desulfovibrio mangrovi]
MQIAVLSDIHGNLEAFQSVLADMKQQVPPPAEIISLGDNLGYGPDPEACVRLVRELGVLSVMGNHELGVTRSKCRNWFNPQSREALQRTCELVSEEVVEYIAGFPMSLSRHGALFVHGLPPDSALKYLYEQGTKQVAELFDAFAEPLAFIGHTHELELVEMKAGRIIRGPLAEGVHYLDRSKRYLINIGAVGQPRDGDRRAKYVLWDTETWELQVRFVEYDVQTTVRKFKEVGMPFRYAERLL